MAVSDSDVSLTSLPSFPFDVQPEQKRILDVVCGSFLLYPRLHHAIGLQLSVIVLICLMRWERRELELSSCVSRVLVGQRHHTFNIAVCRFLGRSPLPPLASG